MTVWQLIPATTRTTGKDGQVCSQTTCSGDPNGPPVPNVTPGPVESGVQDEIGGLAAEARPGLAQAALCMARLLDNPKAVNQQPAAAKVLAAMLENCARHRRADATAVCRWFGRSLRKVAPDGQFARLRPCEAPVTPTASCRVIAPAIQHVCLC